MKKIGKIETVTSIIPKAYEVIEIEGKMFAGTDAFQFPNNKHDLRCLECLLIPQEWRWTERLIVKDADYGEPASAGKGKYQVVKGPRAKAVLEDMLTRYETGCLALFDKQYPYAIPINHAYRDGKLYMHCGKHGKKLSLIHQNPNACYMLYGISEDMPKNVRSCHLPYESIIFYGNVRICIDPEEKEQAIRELTDQYGTPYQHGFADMIEILVFEIDHATARNGRFKPASKREIFYVKF